MKGMVDVCGGKMSIDEICREIRYYMSRSPMNLTVVIKRRKNGYHATLWIPRNEFGRNKNVKND